jgi:putative ABC transport system permease protein
MNLWTYTIREAQRRPGRTALTMFGITLGLATIVATRLTIQTVHRAQRDLFDEVAGPAALEIVAPGIEGFDGRFAPSLAAVPGVKAVIPRVQGLAAVAGRSGNVPVAVLGIDPACAAAFAGLSLREGQAHTDPNDALLDGDLAQALGLQVSDPVRVWAPAGPVELRLTGLLRPREAAARAGGVLVVALASAQRLFALPQRINSIQVLLTEQADSHGVQAAVARCLPPGLTVQPPGRFGDLAQTTMLATEQGLGLLSAVALIAAAFVILNTFLLNLGERRQQLAILRALGASQGQVTRLLLGEALLLGLGGSLAGCGTGMVLAWALLRAMERFLGVALPGVPLTIQPFVVALLLGPATTLAAAGVPVWCAGRRQPLDELLRRPCHSADCLPRRICQAGLLCLALGVALQIGLCSGWFSTATGQVLVGPVLSLALIGAILALPLVGTPLLRLAMALPLGLAGTLAGQQLTRRPGRTSLSAGVLFLALAMAIGFGHCLRGIMHDLRHWYQQTFLADFYVRGSMPDTTLLRVTALPETLADEMAHSEAVAAVDCMAFVPATANSRPILVMARTFAPDQPLPLDLHEGEARAVGMGLVRGQVVLGTGLAQRLGLHRGDQVTLATVHGPQRLTIAGTAAEYAAGGSAAYLEWHTAKQLLGVPGVHAFLVSAQPGTAGLLAPTLQAFCNQHHLMLQSNAALRRQIDLLLARVSGVLWALIGLAFLVASLGIVNTLKMNVQDQTREFGMLRALGLTGGQVYTMVVLQALLLGAMSLVPGAFAGVALAYVINRSSAAWSGPPVAFQIDGLVVIGCSVLALAIALLAALAPARQAARLPVTRALQA